MPSTKVSARVMTPRTKGICLSFDDNRLGTGFVRVIICPDGFLTDTEKCSFPRIITPSRTACPPYELRVSDIANGRRY